MKKRIISLFLVLFIILPAVAVAPSADSKAVIAWNVPAIPADEGQAIDLSAYAVQFASGEEAASDVVWTYDGGTVTSFTPQNAGVYNLTANSGSKTKSVYVVAKKAADTEYVLYYNGFDSADALEGFVKSTSASRYKVEDGKFVMDARNMDMARITLPSWLGEFGDYSITASVMMSDERDNTRWNSICYRANGSSYPFYHMCVRKTCGTGSGVEFAMRTPANGWDVMENGTHTVNQTNGKYYTYNVKVQGDIIIHSIDGNAINYNDAPKTYQAGSIGLIANYSVMHVDYIKVALQLEVPRIDVPETLVVTTDKIDNITNALANVAFPANAAALSELSDANSVVLPTNGTDVFGADGSRICALSEVFGVIGKNVVPVFECKNTTAVDGVINAVKTQTVVDASILSDVPDVLIYARKKQPLLRGIIDLRGKYSGTLKASDAAEIRRAINGNNIKTALFDASCLDHDSAEELRSMLLTVWAYTDSEDDVELLHAILTGAHAIVTPSPAKVKAACSLFASDALTRTPVIIGHRGNPTNAPENSISSYRKAYENGADIIETDVYLSTDGEVVVMHDSSIKRTTDCTAETNIETLSLAQIKQYHLWGENNKFKTQFPDERIPTLREIFELMQECDGLKLFIEIKTSKPAVCGKIVDLAKEYGMMERITVISFNLNQLVNMHSASSEISCGYLMNAPTSSSSPDLAARALSEVITSVVGKNTTYNPSYTSLTDKLLAAANARGITVWPWTYTASGGEKFAFAFKAGFNGLTTNDAQYTKNNVKYIYAPAGKLLVTGSESAIDVTAVTYGKAESDISSKVKITVVSGGDVVSAAGGKLKALKEGTAYVVCSYTTNLPVGSAKGSYTLYTDVIRVDVSDTVIVTGDFTGDGFVSSSDAIYLLRHVLFSEDYPVNQPADIDKNGKIDSADAIYLLRHVLFPKDFPLE